jgi:uncharacterized membrane protein YtjA (UPF0391 family)
MVPSFPIFPHSSAQPRAAQARMEQIGAYKLGLASEFGKAIAMSLLKWALIMLVVSLVAALLGFTGLSAASADVARILFYIFLVVFLVLLVMGLMGTRAARGP